MSEKLEKPIFIFGCCNSGTTILWKALKKHKDLAGPDIEGQDLEGLPDLMKHHLGKATFRLWAHPKFKLNYYVDETDYNAEDNIKVRLTYKAHVSKEKRLITKSPADTLRARLLQSYFPDSYFVAIVRNGYAVSEGIVRKRKYDPERPEFEGLLTTIDEAAEQWFRANTIVVSHEKFLEHYKVIKYESLIQKPEETLFSILGFCGLENADFSVPEFDKHRNKEQISRLDDYEIETITRIAQPMLVHFEYPILNRKLKW